MPLPILILGSGHGLRSLYDWVSASAYVPGSLQLDVRFVRSKSSGIYGTGFFEAKYLLPSNRSLSLAQVLPPTNSDWQLTWWSVRKADSKSWETFGKVGGAGGEGPAIQSTMELDLTCS